MILAPATMASESNPKEAARKCLEEVELDPESYRIGHTKARDKQTPYPLCVVVVIIVCVFPSKGT